MKLISSYLSSVIHFRYLSNSINKPNFLHFFAVLSAFFKFVTEYWRDFREVFSPFIVPLFYNMFARESSGSAKKKILHFMNLCDKMTQNIFRRGVNDLPNIKASILSVKSDAKRRARNVAEKTRVRRAIRSVNDAVAAGNAEEAKSLLVAAYKSIDQAAANNVYHKNAAARKKSRLAKKVNALAQ